MSNFVKSIYSVTEALYASADQFLKMLSAKVSLFIMPKMSSLEGDSLPIPNVNPYLIKESSENATLLSNPCEFTVNGTSFIGSSGENISTICKYTSLTPLEAAQNVLNWGHLCPDFPHDNHCLPRYDKDPFFIRKQPNVMFTGNQYEFATSIEKNEVNGTTLNLVLPTFKESGKVILIDVDSTEFIEIELN